jgi:hypothetical protein
MARLEIKRPDAIDDPEPRRMALASGDEMYGVRTFGVAPMGPRSHAVLERGYDA